jgi:uncharacterized protein (TIGR00106 family)
VSELQKKEVFMVAVAQVTVTPLGTGSTSLSEYIAEVHRVLEQSGPSVRYELTAMNTIIEGEWDDIMKVVRQMHEAPFAQGVMRVSTTITIDDRRDKKGSIQQKVKSVEEKLGR